MLTIVFLYYNMVGCLLFIDISVCSNIYLFICSNIKAFRSKPLNNLKTQVQVQTVDHR